MTHLNSTWKAFERSRTPFYRRAEREFNKSIGGQLGPILEWMENNEGQVPSQEIIERLIDEAPIRKGYEYTYRDAGVAYAERIHGAYSSGESLRREFEHFMERFVRENCGERITSVTNVTRQRVTRSVSNAISGMEGDSVEDIADVVRRAIRDEGGKISKWRSKLIARTEVATASNIGQQAGAEAANLPMVKVWMATMDGRVRDRHAAMDGVRVGLENDFIVGGEPMKTPGDPRGSAANTINCRCAVAYRVIKPD